MRGKQHDVVPDLPRRRFEPLTPRRDLDPANVTEESEASRFPRDHMLRGKFARVKIVDLDRAMALPRPVVAPRHRRTVPRRDPLDRVDLVRPEIMRARDLLDPGARRGADQRVAASAQSTVPAETPASRAISVMFRTGHGSSAGSSSFLLITVTMDRTGLTANGPYGARNERDYPATSPASSPHNLNRSTGAGPPTKRSRRPRASAEISFVSGMSAKLHIDRSGRT